MRLATPNKPQNMKIRHFTTIAFCAAASAVSGTLKGAVTAQDAFNYTVGSDNLSGQGTAGNGWAGAWGNASSSGTQSVTTGSLDSPVTTFESGNKTTIQTGGTNNSLIFRSLASPITTGTVYVGFIFKRNTASNRTAGLSLYSGLSTELLLIGINDDSAGKLQISGTNTTTTATNGTSYQLVLRVDFNASGSNEALNLFVNQAAEGTADATISNLNFAAGFDTIRLFAGSSRNGLGAQSADFDEVRIATTYADALAIPEPSAALLVGCLGALTLLRRRRD